MPPLEGYKKIAYVPTMPSIEEQAKEKGLKVLNPSKILTRLTVLLIQIKAKNNSYKLKNEIRKMLYVLYQDNKITKNLYNSMIKSL